MDVAWLLHDLCTKLGYCSALRLEAEFIDDPPASVDEFTDRVLLAEGLDPAITEKADRRVLQRFIEARIEQRA